MAEFLTTAAISHHVERMLRGTQRRITLVSPYLKFSKTLTERLRDCDNRKVDIVLVYGKRDLDSKTVEALRPLRRLSLHYLENLHAKCYLNEDCVIIGSMNLLEFSEKTNREMGVLFTRSEDPGLFGEVQREVDSIVRHSDRQTLEAPQPEGFWEGTGYCIRCGLTIPLNPERPFCPECYAVWSQWSDPLYVERRCHCCGSDHATSMSKPLCKSCYFGRSRVS